MLNLIRVLESNDLVKKKVVKALKSCSSPAFNIKENALTELFKNPYKYLQIFIKKLTTEEQKLLKPLLIPEEEEVKPPLIPKKEEVKPPLIPKKEIKKVKTIPKTSKFKK